MIRFLLLMMLFLSIGNFLYGQKTIIIDKYQAWNTSNGLQSASVISSAVNNQGEIFIGHNTGVQKCDGAAIFNFFNDRISFSVFPTVYISKENHLYVFNNNQIIRIKNQEVLRMNQEMLNHGITDITSIAVIHETSNELWLHFSPNRLGILDKNSFSLTSSSKIHSFEFPHFTSSIFHKDEALVIEVTCIKKIYKKENYLQISECLPLSIPIHNFIKISENEGLFLSNNKVLKGNFKLNNLKELARLPSDKKVLRSRMVSYDDKKIIITFDNDVFLLHIHTGELIHLVNNEEKNSFFKNGPINNCLVDKFNNIYIFSLAEGFVKFSLPSQNVKTIYKKNSEPNFVSALHIDKSKNLLLSGLFKAGISIQTLEGKELYKDTGDFTPVCIWNAGNDQYFYTTLLSKNLNKISKLNGVYSTQVVDTFSLGFSYYSSILSQNKYKTELINGLFLYSIVNTNSTNVKIKSIEIPKNANIGYNCGYKSDYIYLGGFNEVMILDTFYQFVKKYAFKDKAYIRKLLPSGDGNWWMASDKGLELLNKNFEVIRSYTTGPVFSIIKGDKNEIWCGTNNGIICINDGALIRFTANDGLGCQEYNGHCVSQLSDGRLVFGGIGGIDIFDNKVMLQADNTNDCLLSDISIIGEKNVLKYVKNDKLILSHNEASVSFFLSPIGMGDVSNHIIQYRMLGMNDGWINGRQNRNLNYQLSPGTYEFQYSAGKYLIDQLKNFKTLKIVVLPPYYKTWWFVSLVTVAFAGIVFYYFSLINRIKFEKQKTVWAVKENLLNQRSSFTKELHDLIGSKISIVSRNIDFILDKENPLQSSKKENLLVQTLQLSKQIAKDIRDTIWATDKDGISIRDLVSRIKDFTFYYEHLPMKISIDVDINAQKITFQPQEGLNLLRILQEAIHNAAKHSEADTCDVKFSAENNLTIDIIDKGKGIPPESELKKGQGLENMANRAQKINYSFAILPMPKGTHLRFIKYEKV